MRAVRYLAERIRGAIELLAPAEGEEVLVGLVVLLLVAGGLRHRTEPWLRTLAAAKQPPVVEALAPELRAQARAQAQAPRTPAAASAVAALQEIDAKRFGRVDLNRADREELESLPGVGPKLAARIIDDRRLRGPYASLADLDRVPGIGPHLLARIRDAATVGPGAAPAGDPDSFRTSVPGSPPSRAHLADKQPPALGGK